MHTYIYIMELRRSTCCVLPRPGVLGADTPGASPNLSEKYKEGHNQSKWYKYVRSERHSCLRHRVFWRSTPKLHRQQHWAQKISPHARHQLKTTLQSRHTEIGDQSSYIYIPRTAWRTKAKVTLTVLDPNGRLISEESWSVNVHDCEQIDLWCRDYTILDVCAPTSKTNYG